MMHAVKLGNSTRDKKKLTSKSTSENLAEGNEGEEAYSDRDT